MNAGPALNHSRSVGVAVSATQPSSAEHLFEPAGGPSGSAGDTPASTPTAGPSLGLLLSFFLSFRRSRRPRWLPISTRQRRARRLSIRPTIAALPSSPFKVEGRCSKSIRPRFCRRRNESTAGRKLSGISPRAAAKTASSISMSALQIRLLRECQDPRKSRVTIRQLLDFLRSGAGLRLAGERIRRSTKIALRLPVVAEPGKPSSMGRGASGFPSGPEGEVGRQNPD